MVCIMIAQNFRLCQNCEFQELCAALSSWCRTWLHPHLALAVELDHLSESGEQDLRLQALMHKTISVLLDN